MNSRVFADKVLVFLKKYNNYTEKEELLAHYGLETIYILITKTIFITIISLIIGITKEMFIFVFFYGGLRIPASGIHMKKSIYCTFLSTIIFIGFPFLCLYTKIYFGIKLIICGLGIICFALYSPADTHKKPLINKRRRKALRIRSIITLFIYVFLIFILKKNFISNAIIYSIIAESLLILPITYKIFNMPYNNYLNYE